MSRKKRISFETFVKAFDGEGATLPINLDNLRRNFRALDRLPPSDVVAEMSAAFREAEDAAFLSAFAAEMASDDRAYLEFGWSSL